MDVRSVLTLLSEANAPSRDLDAAIAEVVGWKRRDVVRTDPMTGVEMTRTLWLVPSSDSHGKVPFYTSNLQEAYDLASSLAPTLFGGFSWEKGKASAKIADGPYIEAATPAIALCIAALYMGYKKGNLRNNGWKRAQESDVEMR